jgi:hypothetical protein
VGIGKDLIMTVRQSDGSHWLWWNSWDEFVVFCAGWDLYVRIKWIYGREDEFWHVCEALDIFWDWAEGSTVKRGT